MEFLSERFGKIEYSEAEVLRFPQGLIGFPDMARFFVYAQEEVAPLAWLHSLDDSNLAFLIVDPFVFFPEYEVKVKLPAALRRQMGETADLRVLCIVTIHSDFARSTVNLLGPLVGVALAIGLAFGLGGREIAARQLEQWQGLMKEVDQKLAAQAPETPDAPDTPAALDQPQA